MRPTHFTVLTIAQLEQLLKIAKTPYQIDGGNPVTPGSVNLFLNLGAASIPRDMTRLVEPQVYTRVGFVGITGGAS